MLIPFYNIINSHDRFSAIASMLERKQRGNKIDVDEDVMFSNINNAIADLYAGLEMSRFIDNRFLPSGTASILSMIRNMVDMYRSQYEELRKDESRPIEDYLAVIRGLGTALEPIQQNDSLCNMSGSWYMSENGFYTTWDNGRYVLPDMVVDTVISRIPSKKECNVLDINAGNLDPLQVFRRKFPQAKLYGVTNSSISLSKDERARFERLAISDPLEAVKISNDSFDIVLATPSLTLNRNPEKKSYVTDERMTLERAYKYLRRGGILVYPVPRAFLSKNIVTYIAKNLGDVQVIEDVYSVYGSIHNTVIIMGTKKPPLERTLDPKVYSILRNLVVMPERITGLEKKEYRLPPGLVQVTKFRSNRLDDAEMEMMFAQSTAMADFWKGQKVTKISDMESHPLLPFNVGQLGLVLTSGCLDGVVEEGNNCSHVIKGRVVKVSETSQDVENGKITEQKTISNRVEISMFLPDGTYKCLA